MASQCGGGSAGHLDFSHNWEYKHAHKHAHKDAHKHAHKHGPVDETCGTVWERDHSGEYEH